MATDTTPAPTDEEIVDVPSDTDIEFLFEKTTGHLFVQHRVDFLAFARAVLAKWGAQPAASPAPLTRQQLRESYHRSTGCTLGNDIHLAERVCSVVEQAHGITTATARARLGTNQAEGQNVPKTVVQQTPTQENPI